LFLSSPRSKRLIGSVFDLRAAFSPLQYSARSRSSSSSFVSTSKTGSWLALAPQTVHYGQVFGHGSPEGRIVPKRIVDGDALARSDKLAQVQPVSYRAEYAYLLTLALANGSFEVDPRKVWSNLYSYNRPDITADGVAAMLDEFERVKMLFRWTEPNGKVWGHWVGSDKPGRLPAPSRLRDGEKVGVPIPREKLKQFLEPIPEETGSVTETVPYGSSTEPVPVPSVGFGFGFGFGSGFGSGSGVREPEPKPEAKVEAERPCSEERKDLITADMAWRGVMDRCRLAGDTIGGTLRDLAFAAGRAGENLASWADEAVEAYQDYHSAIRAEDLQITFGAPAFFGQGIWRNRSLWRWKEGRGPRGIPAPPKFDSLEDKLRSIGAPAEAVS
jgi:hypothetical protein